MAANAEQIALLAEPTPASDIKQRTQGGKTLDYITARFVQDRLDACVGPGNWKSQYGYDGEEPERYIQCTISILVDHGDGTPPEWVPKTDAGVPSDFEPAKGMHSDAFKRAGVQWGIARDLYDSRAEDAPPMKPAPKPAPARAVMAARPAYVTMDDEIPIMGSLPDMEAPWVCPIHGEVKVVPGGYSERTRKNYSAFYSCTEPGCDQKPPFGLRPPA